jgi:hypothetical protein
MWLNQHEIEIAASQQHSCENVRKGYQFLLKFVQAVNEQSDGWAYWSAPRKAANKLIELLDTAGKPFYPTHGTVTPAQIKKAISPIRRMVTYQSNKQKAYGNKFEFDVDTALVT